MLPGMFTITTPDLLMECNRVNHSHETAVEYKIVPLDVKITVEVTFFNPKVLEHF